MFLHILSSSIFLPLVVASMIIAQIHLENYQIDINKRHPENNWSNFYIIFIYIAQVYSSGNLYYGTDAIKH